MLKVKLTVEQLLRFFGADDNQIKSIDSRPQLFFDKEEIKLGDEIIKKYIGEEDFGTLISDSLEN